MSARALVVADLHIGKSPDLYPERLAEQEDAWRQALQVGVDQDCDVVLFAGDATEHRSPTSAERAAFQRPLVGYPIPVVAIPGNHDVQRDLPTVIDLAGQTLGGSLVTAAPGPQVLLAGGLAVCTLPWAPPGRVRASLNGTGDADASIAGLLVRVAEGLRAEAGARAPDLPCVLLGHWATTGWKTPTGLPTDEIGGVVFPVDELERIGFDAAFWGHVHAPGEIVPGVWSVGSPLCLDFGESTVDHGCWIWEDGRADFVKLDYRPFVTLDWDAADVETLLALPGPPDGWTSTVDGAVVRLRYTATAEEAHRIDETRVRRALLDAGAHRVWQTTPVVERVSRARAQHVTGGLDPAAAVDAWLDGQPFEPDMRDTLRARAADYLRKAA